MTLSRLLLPRPSAWSGSGKARNLHNLPLFCHSADHPAPLGTWIFSCSGRGCAGQKWTVKFKQQCSLFIHHCSLSLCGHYLVQCLWVSMCTTLISCTNCNHLLSVWMPASRLIATGSFSSFGRALFLTLHYLSRASLEQRHWYFNYCFTINVVNQSSLLLIKHAKMQSILLESILLTDSATVNLKMLWRGSACMQK